MDELACIKAFVATVKHGSQHAAAVKLHQTDAAISKKLSKLEESLGVSLLNRDNKQSQLTDIGKQYYQRYVDILAQLDDTKQLANQINSMPRGRLLVRCSRPIAKNILAPKIKAFNKKYPHIFLVLNISASTADYVPDKDDIVIAPDIMIHENLVRKKLLQTRDVICASPNFLNKHTKIAKLSMLREIPYISHCMRSPLDRVVLNDKAFVDANNVVIRIDDEEIAVELALQHLGFIYVKDYVVAKAIQSKKLIEIFANDNKTHTNIAVHYHYKTYLDAKIRAFTEFFSNELN